MSDAPYEMAVPEPEARRPLTPEASNILGWWWLALVFAMVLLIAIWPSLFEGPGSFGTYLAVIICTAIVVLGTWVSTAWTRAKEWSAGAMRMAAIVGLIAGLVAIGYFLYAVAFATPPAGSPGFFGPTPILAGFLWVILIVLPFIFGLLVIFGLMSDAADEWLHPPILPAETHPNLKIDPATAAIMAGGGAAVSHVVSDEALMTDLSRVITAEDMDRPATGSIPGYREQSIEMVGNADEDLSVQVVGGHDVTQDEGSLAELAALEQALSEDAKKKKAKKGKKEEKKKPSGGDEPLSVDDDFKL